ncbi:sigma-54-dependent transcriptional regulator [Saccharicrinis sp. FJH54]|uniref:sigma-54-dependent transcriptional regulator n=1 Tax=Saccharicrinis sp. FJH54 TaxID=3344665 RepID=UPI0035D40F27
MANILVIDDDVTFCMMLKTYLEKHKYKVTSVFSPATVKDLITKTFFDVVLTDLRLPDINGMDVIRLIKSITPKTQIIMMTSYANYNTAIQSIKEGAFNYIPKPFLPDEVLKLIEEAIETAKRDDEHKPGKKEENKDFVEGKSPASKRLKRYIELVAPTPMSVLIIGESGTGKELVARTIHNLSDRRKKPFVAVDCGAIPRELVASEFFGHVKGSFTGAVTDKVGQFEAANGGTLFLDEIGNLSYDSQVQLLRTIQERVIKPVGSTKEVKIDVRIVAATNEDLRDACEKGDFREDLFHRLNEFMIEVPALRERQADIMMFAEHFLDQANAFLNRSVDGFDNDVTSVFMQYDWPGNLREMLNVVKRATLLTEGNEISRADIPEELYEKPDSESAFSLYNSQNEKELILKALDATGHNKSQAARLLKIDRKTLYNKLRLYNIELSDGKEGTD